MSKRNCFIFAIMLVAGALSAKAEEQQTHPETGQAFCELVMKTRDFKPRKKPEKALSDCLTFIASDPKLFVAVQVNVCIEQHRQSVFGRPWPDSVDGISSVREMITLSQGMTTCSEPFAGTNVVDESISAFNGALKKSPLRKWKHRTGIDCNRLDGCFARPTLDMLFG